MVDTPHQMRLKGIKHILRTQNKFPPSFKLCLRQKQCYFRKEKPTRNSKRRNHHKEVGRPQRI